MNTSSKSNSNLRRAASVVLGLALAHTALADSLWNPAVSRNQSGDKKARMVGDILNVLVQESNTLSKSAKTETAKDSSTDASLSSFLFGTAAGTTTGSQMLKHKGANPGVLTNNDNLEKPLNRTPSPAELLLYRPSRSRRWPCCLLQPYRLQDSRYRSRTASRPT